jgi:single-stranded-DNA-specific exonuclease
LVAGRIKDRLNRPVIAFARTEEGSLRGSARSVSGINIRDVLDGIAARRPGLIEKFGGHAMAAGMTLREASFEEFRAAFAGEIAARTDVDALSGILYTDGELSGAELSLETARVLRSAGPWGQGFPEPVFDGAFRIADARIVGGRHLKLQLRGGGEAGAPALDAIAFGYVGGALEHPSIRSGVAVRLAYRLELNEYNGAERVQLNCQHLQPGESV